MLEVISILEVLRCMDVHSECILFRNFLYMSGFGNRDHKGVTRITMKEDTIILIFK